MSTDNFYSIGDVSQTVNHYFKFNAESFESICSKTTLATCGSATKSYWSPSIIIFGLLSYASYQVVECLVVLVETRVVFDLFKGPPALLDPVEHRFKGDPDVDQKVGRLLVGLIW